MDLKKGANILIMTKCEELLGLISELQCHECKDVPGPNGNQKNRYSCFDASHTLCEEHKKKCPCGSKVGKRPSPVIAKLLQNLPWMCQNFKNGCLDSKMNIQDLDHHQNECIYRKVFCPKLVCKVKDKVLFKDVIEHLKICLNEPIEEEEMLNGDANKFLVLFDSNNFEFRNGGYWYPSKMTSTCGAVFFTSGYIKNHTVYLWVRLFGSVDEAKKYCCTFSIKHEIGNEKFSYSGPVHTLDKGFEDIITSGSLLSIGVDAAKRSLDDQKRLEVEIIITNLKIEAMDDDMESGVSDGE